MGILTYFLVWWCLYQLEAPFMVWCVFWFSAVCSFIDWFVDI